MDLREVIGDLLTDGNYGAVITRRLITRDEVLFDEEEDKFQKRLEEFMDSSSETEPIKTSKALFIPVLKITKYQIKKSINKETYEDVIKEEQRFKKNQVTSKKQLRIQRIIDFENEYPNWKEICEKEKSDLDTIKYRMYQNEDYEPETNTRGFDSSCHPKYGLMSELERDMEFQHLVRFWLNMDYQFSDKNEKMLMKARKRADKIRVKYEDWCGAIYERFGNEGVIYVTHFASKMAEKLIKEFVLGKHNQPMKIPIKRVSRTTGRRRYKKSLEDQLEETRRKVMNYYEEGGE